MWSRKILIPFSLCVGLAACKTTKSDVKEEWKDVDKERAEAVKETREYSARQKQDYEAKVEKRFAKYDDQLVGLRADMVKASGMDKENLQDTVWQLERELVEARSEFNQLQDEDALSWSDEQAQLEGRLNHIDIIINNGKALAH